MHQLLLDSRIRDWVLFPILLTMFLFGIIRFYVSVILKSEPKRDITKIRQSQTLQRGLNFKENSKYISKEGFKMRKKFFKDLYDEPIKQQTLQMMTDPNNAVELLKGNFAMIIPNILIFGWLSYFYSGFVLAKFPFSLTERFKGMVQRGLNLNSLDVSYVTSSSIFFLFLFGSNGVFSLIFGEENLIDDTKLMQQQMTGGIGANPQIDYGALFKSEKENLNLLEHKFILE